MGTDERRQNLSLVIAKDKTNMSFLDDFTKLSSGNACPEPFMTWSGLSLLGAVTGRKIWTMHGNTFPIYSNLYVCMVGTPGSGKSTAMNYAEKLFLKCFPDLMVSESIQSREDILKKMGAEQCERAWKDDKGLLGDPGKIYTYRPFYCLVDEMENFVSVDEKKMVGTLVGIYSRDSFGTGFKNDANKNQRIFNPYMSLLGCTIPEWMMSSLRESLFVGGLGRRMVIVHATKDKDIPNPTLPEGYNEIMARLEAHLFKLDKHTAILKRTPEADKFWLEWFSNPNRKNKIDPVLMQFHETQHIQMLKIATLLACSDNPEAEWIEVWHLQKAYLLLKRLEGDVVRLTSGIGRNELAGVGARVLEMIREQGGAMPKTTLLRVFGRYFQLREFQDQMEQYVQAEQLVRLTDPGTGKEVFMLPDFYQNWLKKKTPSTTSPPVSGHPV